MSELHPRIRTELLAIAESLTADGTLPSRPLLQTYYDAFRRAFGPEVLRSLDGQDLLERMHAHGNRDSLVYWLEFKDDETFPAIFGSIAGGSALKFGVYRRAETGTWATSGEGSAPRDITVTEAIDIARRHRDQLLAAADVVAALPTDADESRYVALQRDLARVAPDVQNTVWGHKYLALLFPDVLDDFHVARYQQYNLVRVLQLPTGDASTWSDSRYEYAGRFVALAKELNLPLHCTSTVLGRRHGPPKTYWRVGTTDDDAARRKYWPAMRDEGMIAIGWPALGDLSRHVANQQSKGEVAAALQQNYPNTPQAIGRKASEILRFVARMAEGDRVAAADGQTVLGVGEITGPYRYEPSTPMPHHREVRWDSTSEWRVFDNEGNRTTVAALKDPRNQVEIERHLIDDAGTSRPVASTSAGTAKPPADSTAGAPLRGSLPRVAGTVGQIQSILERKGQAVLYGPPGTGKTFWALRAARELAALRAFGVSFAALDDAQRHRILKDTAAGGPLVRVTTFHPEYGYEDFIEGYRPRAKADGTLFFQLEPGVFRRLCAEAVLAPSLDFYLVIDEINRGDVPRIFGELLTLLEQNKRGEDVVLPASGQLFHVPKNVYVLGTMNTADRSIALLDVALRRRFGFFELMPDYALLKGVSIDGLPLGAWLFDLNQRVRATGGGDARNRQIGHAFFLGESGVITTAEQLAAVLRDDIVPLLEEYAYDDFSQLAEMLGPALVDLGAQRIRRELLDSGRSADMVAALLRPELATATAAVMTEAGTSDILDDDDAESALPASPGPA